MSLILLLDYGSDLQLAFGVERHQALTEAGPAGLLAGEASFGGESVPRELYFYYVTHLVGEVHSVQISLLLGQQQQLLFVLVLFLDDYVIVQLQEVAVEHHVQVQRLQYDVLFA